MTITLLILFLCLFQPVILLPHQCQYQLAPTSSGSYHQFSQVNLAPYELQEIESGVSVTEIHPTASAAASACYQYCNQSELMTFSSQFWKHHQTPLTLLDRATQLLLETDFFKNHMAMTDQDGPGGLGCFALESPSKFTLYALEDPICRFTRSVICGGGGQTGTLKDATQSVEHTGKVNLAETISRYADPSRFKTTFFSGISEETEETQESVELSSTPCTSLGALDSSNLPRLTLWLEQYYSPHASVVIKTWNGDTYGAESVPSCLVFSLAQGVQLAPCATSNLVLCSSGQVMSYQ